MNKNVSTAFAISVIVLLIGFFAFVFLFDSGDQAIEPVAQNVIQKKEIAKIDTSGWKLYQNKQYGYEMKYPADWEIGVMGLVDPAAFSAPIFSLPGCLEKGSGVCPSFMIGNIHTVTEGETIAQDINLNTNDKIIAEKSIKISGEDASFIEYYQASYGRRDGKMGLVRQEMKVIHNGTLYRIYIHEDAKADKIKTSADWEHRKTFVAMLESFRFVENNAAAISSKTDVASGVLYTNEEFGFSVLLPLGWEKYQVSIQKDKGDDKHTYIYFLMPTSDKKWGGAFDKNTGKLVPGVVEIFVIVVNDLATWDKDANSKECLENPNPSCPEAQSVLAKNDKYVFSASYGNGILPKDVQKFIEGTSAAKFLSEKFKLLN